MICFAFFFLIAYLVPASQDISATQKLANGGDAAAQYNLGVFYGTGQGVTQDAQKAVFWYRKAADQGYANAQFNLGVMYGSGQGVVRDPQQAVIWYRKLLSRAMRTLRSILDPAMPWGWESLKMTNRH